MDIMWEVNIKLRLKKLINGCEIEYVVAETNCGLLSMKLRNFDIHKFIDQLRQLSLFKMELGSWCLASKHPYYTRSSLTSCPKTCYPNILCLRFVPPDKRTDYALK
jgi:hypothetical protein